MATDPNDPYRTGLSDDDFRRQQRFDPDFEPGSASSSKIALFAVGIAVLLGALFYGLNNTSVKEAQTPPPSRTAQTQNSANPAAPSGMRDVTPKANTEPGTTTGSAPAAPNNNK